MKFFNDLFLNDAKYVQSTYAMAAEQSAFSIDAIFSFSFAKYSQVLTTFQLINKLNKYVGKMYVDGWHKGEWGIIHHIAGSLYSYVRLENEYVKRWWFIFVLITPS